ncbi:AAA family ATPase [Shewanella sp. YIC-542]|uniref:AAA family ATPase n=1 Tax=Shewanella mytili TaxID=3377111 RepID=UPI00398E7BE8
MKIIEVKWKNHPVLGDLHLDFSNVSTHKPYSTIVFAGENGTGKSTILEEISNFLNLGSFEYFEYISYVTEVDNKLFKAVPTNDGTTHVNFFDLIDENEQRIKIREDRYNNRVKLDENTTDLRHYGCVYSKARADYKTQKISTTTTSSLDKEKYDVDGNDDFTSLKQLIVDVVNQDNNKYAEMNKTLGTSPKSWGEFYPESNLFRFKNSFDNFFEKLEYEKVTDIDSEKTITFLKNGISIPLDELSTGEKQIVFRGIYLLRNSNLLSGSAILVDEPELSMHPKWQQKILNYYKGLFTENDSLKVQMFFATHSDHVIKEALSDKVDNIVITLEEINGIIQVKKIDSPSVLPSVTSAETNYLAFDITSNDYHIELYGWLQDKESKNSVKSCDTYIRSHPCFDLSKHQKSSGFGSTTYETLPTYIRNAIHHPDSGNVFTEDELRISTELLIELCR